MRGPTAPVIAAGIEPEGVDVKPPDFSHIARAYGLTHRKISSRDALEALLKHFGERPQAVVIEISADDFK